MNGQKFCVPCRSEGKRTIATRLVPKSSETSGANTPMCTPCAAKNWQPGRLTPITVPGTFDEQQIEMRMRTPAPRLCMCGCGQRLPLTYGVQDFINGHLTKAGMKRSGTIARLAHA